MWLNVAVPFDRICHTAATQPRQPFLASLNFTFTKKKKSKSHQKHTRTSSLNKRDALGPLALDQQQLDICSATITTQTQFISDGICLSALLFISKKVEKKVKKNLGRPVASLSTRCPYHITPSPSLIASAAMPSRKRTHSEATAPPPAPHELSLLERIRKLWQFANLCQWIFLFGRIVKIDDSLDAEVRAISCISPGSLFRIK